MKMKSNNSALSAMWMLTIFFVHDSLGKVSRHLPENSLDKLTENKTNVIQPSDNLNHTEAPARGEQTKSESSDKGDNFPFNFSWLLPGKLAGSNCPSSQDQLASLYDAGVRYLVTLSPDAQPQHYGVDTSQLPDLKHVNIFFPDFTPPTLDIMIEFERIAREARSTGSPVTVHCRMGYGRTGTMLSLYLVTWEGRSAREAVREVREKRPLSVETQEQEEAVAKWEEVLKMREELKENVEFVDHDEVLSAMDVERAEELLSNDNLMLPHLMSVEAM